MPIRPANNGRAAQPVSARKAARRRVSVSTPALHLTGAPPQAVGIGETERYNGPIANDHIDLPMAPAHVNGAAVDRTWPGVYAVHDEFESQPHVEPTRYNLDLTAPLMTAVVPVCSGNREHAPKRLTWTRLGADCFQFFFHRASWTFSASSLVMLA
ncbi:hypothetical protein CSOJ01_05532 [Colletotrichum sojae]|uniref:Uncharacterized protein n=1 Tax=Colletotrichum sojae TaxID=2175907 RepID=A0A8H6MWM1_9PEZI|nr:hypothetical protein CSOJ01_05532 [Colletotrichum sojae]